MKCISLKMVNFKGVKELIVELNGKDASIFGANAAGKTTFADAFFWLLFDKDSSGAKQFYLKTLDDNNQAFPKLEHLVEGVFESDEGRQIKLKKVFQEKYTTPRGKSAEVFDGHETKYYIDDVPKKKKDYTAKVAELAADEQKFQLLTSPTFFPSMPWQKQRELLLEVCGTVSDADVIASNPDLQDLPGLLEERTVEEFKEMVKSQRGKAKKELEAIPGRVDEATRAIPELKAKDPQPIVNKLKALAKKLASKSDEVSNLKNGGGVAAKRLKLAEHDGAIAEARNRHNAGSSEANDKTRDQLRQKRDELEIDLDTKKSEIRKLEAVSGELADEAVDISEQLVTLGNDWKAVKALQYDGSDLCPTCSQQLPADQVEAAMARFNEDKANRIAEIEKKGGELKSKRETAIEEVKQAAERVSVLSKEVEDLQAEFDKVKADLDSAADTGPRWEETPDYQQLMEERKEIEDEIKSLESGNREAIDKVEAEKAEIQVEIDENNAIISSIDLAQKQHDRIAELNKEQEKLAANIEDFDLSLWLVEQFEKAQAEALSDKVSSKFKLVTFKLFRQQINEGIQPTCEAMVNGVPYLSLNGAGKVQAGFDIINTLSEYYGFFPPIIVDNRESVTVLPEMRAQVISLVVSPEDKDLRVEVAA